MTDKEQNTTFDLWIREHRALLFKVVNVYAFNHFDRDDLFQQIMVQVWRSIPAFKEKSKVSTWLYRIALNTALNWKRDEKKHREGHDEFEPIHGRVLQPVQESQNEQLEWLYQEISKLEEVDRSVTLLMLDGYSYREMAEIMGISESNVGVKIHRIKNYLIKQSKK